MLIVTLLIKLIFLVLIELLRALVTIMSIPLVLWMSLRFLEMEVIIVLPILITALASLPALIKVVIFPIVLGPIISVAVLLFHITTLDFAFFIVWLVLIPFRITTPSSLYWSIISVSWTLSIDGKISLRPIVRLILIGLIAPLLPLVLITPGLLLIL